MAELWDIFDEYGNKTERLHERGKPLQAGDFHLYVEVWIMNQKGEFLASKRTPDRGSFWHTTCGCAVTSEDSLTAALREVWEEIGVVLNINNGQLFKRDKIIYTEGGGAIRDIWLFLQEVNIDDVVLCPKEIADAKWVSMEQIRYMTHDGSFAYPYLDDIFSYCESLT